MAELKHLVRLMRELDDQLSACMRCGMCQAVCPLFAETGREADVARGKLALLEGLMQEMFKDPKGVYERLNRCLLCGSCAAGCPSGVRVLDIFMKARAILSGYMGLSPGKKLVLRGLLARPEIFDRAMELSARFQGIFIKPVSEVLGSSCARFTAPGIKDRHVKRLAEVPFHRRVPHKDTRRGPSGFKVAFFPGCLLDKAFPDTAQAVLDVLDHHGVGVYLPEGFGCCGIPAISSGDMETFLTLVRHNLDKLEAGETDYVVTACATCTATIKKVWPAMAAEESPDLVERVRRLSERTMDIHQFLVSELGVGLSPEEAVAGKEAVAVTYHDPCHLKKSIGVAAEPRKLLCAHPGYRLTEMAEADWCCGMGGSFGLEHYDVSASIGRRKRDNIEASGAAFVATGCPACMIQLTDQLSHAGDDIRVVHAIEVYADALKARRKEKTAIGE
jgi:glycolate oxidase iron-sulfur subunit